VVTGSFLVFIFITVFFNYWAVLLPSVILNKCITAEAYKVILVTDVLLDGSKQGSGLSTT